MANSNDTRVISFQEEYEIQQFQFNNWYRVCRELKTGVKVPRTARAEAIRYARRKAKDGGGQYIGCFKASA